MDKILVFGHKNPDTDSVCGSISLSYLKKAMGLNAEARILGEINRETEFVLKKFKIDVPKYLNDVKVQIKDIKYKKNYYVNEDSSIYEAFHYLIDNNITGIPLIDSKKHFKGYVSLREITNELVVNDSNVLDTNFANLITTLNASKSYQYDEIIKGNVMAVTLPYRLFMDTIPVDEESIVIVGNREHIINYVLSKKIKLLIIIGNHTLTKEQLAVAKKNKVNIIITPYDAFKVCRLINLANPIKSIKRGENAICFSPSDYLTDFLDRSNKYKHTNYPIVNGKGICDGMLRVIDTNEYQKKKVILVDHNEPVQSVDGLDEAQILEIVDHHNIGKINTFVPINFRNMAVGSVNTIIYTLYEEQGIKIPKNIAGVMLSGIISDTLLLASPTTTELDKMVANKLSKIAKLDLKKYGLELLKSGVSIDGMTITDVIYKDFKSYNINDNKFAIGQVFTTDFNDYKKNIDDYILELDNISKSNNYKVCALFITNIITNDSYIIYNTKGSNYLEDAFNIEQLKEGYLIKNIVSRKKQIVPPIMNVLEKI